MNESNKHRNQADDSSISQPDLKTAITWFKSRMNITGYNKSMWTPYHDQVIFDFLTCTTTSGDSKSYRLFGYLDLSDKFSLTPSLPSGDIKEVVYFLRRVDIKPDYNDLTTSIQWGQVHGRAVNNLLTSLEGFFLPLFVKSNYLPESIKTDIMPGMNKFLGFLTENANSYYGQTVLYIPQENLNDVVACSQDRALVQRLESIVIQWTGQLKTPVQYKGDEDGPDAQIK